jgi:hypothetical protein
MGGLLGRGVIEGLARFCGALGAEATGLLEAGLDGEGLDGACGAAAVPGLGFCPGVAVVTGCEFGDVSAVVETTRCL